MRKPILLGFLTFSAEVCPNTLARYHYPITLDYIPEFGYTAEMGKQVELWKEHTTYVFSKLRKHLEQNIRDFLALHAAALPITVL